MTPWPGDARRERTTFGGLRRAALMASVPSFGNATTERRLESLLRAARLTGWRKHEDLPGRPDFTWRKGRVVAFVDGCFWHGHDCNRNLKPKANALAWRVKVCRNRVRDRRVARRLRREGWSVLRIWECALARSPQRCVDRIRQRLHRQESLGGMGAVVA